MAMLYSYTMLYRLYKSTSVFVFVPVHSFNAPVLSVYRDTCIKDHDMDSLDVQRQLRCAGMLESIRIRRVAWH